MTDPTTWWAPTFQGHDIPSRSMAIPWQSECPPSERESKDALVDRIDELIRANRKEARWALDVEFEEVCSMEEGKNWAFHIGMSPQVNFMLARIDWEATADRFAFDEDEDIPTLSEYVDGLGVE